MKKMSLIFMIFLLLFVVASPSLAVTVGLEYVKTDMKEVNNAVADIIKEAGMPIDVKVVFGEMSGDITALNKASGEDLEFIDGKDVDGTTSGANWAQDEAEKEITFGTFLGATGFHLGLTDEVVKLKDDNNKTVAVVATLEMKLPETFLLEQGVSQADVDALFNAGEAAKDAFFDEFTYFKIFDGADPAIEAKDIVKFLKKEYTDSFPDFIEFDADKENRTFTVGITYILMNAAPKDGQPFIVDKTISISEAGEEDTTGVLFIYDGKNNNELRDPVSLGNEKKADPAPSGSSGGCSTGLPLMLTLLGLPILFYRKK